jgi:hypothetical protein
LEEFLLSGVPFILLLIINLGIKNENDLKNLPYLVETRHKVIDVK